MLVGLSEPCRAPLAPISRPDGGSPATPRKRGRNGQLVGPVPIHMPPSDSAYERSEPPLRADGGPQCLAPLFVAVILNACKFLCKTGQQQACAHSFWGLSHSVKAANRMLHADGSCGSLPGRMC